MPEQFNISRDFLRHSRNALVAHGETIQECLSTIEHASAVGAFRQSDYRADFLAISSAIREELIALCRALSCAKGQEATLVLQDGPSISLRKVFEIVVDVLKDFPGDLLAIHTLYKEERTTTCLVCVMETVSRVSEKVGELLIITDRLREFSGAEPVAKQ